MEKVEKVEEEIKGSKVTTKHAEIALISLLVTIILLLIGEFITLNFVKEEFKMAIVINFPIKDIIDIYAICVSLLGGVEGMNVIGKTLNSPVNIRVNLTDRKMKFMKRILIYSGSLLLITSAFYYLTLFIFEINITSKDFGLNASINAFAMACLAVIFSAKGNKIANGMSIKKEEK